MPPDSWHLWVGRAFGISRANRYKKQVKPAKPKQKHSFGAAGILPHIDRASDKAQCSGLRAAQYMFPENLKRTCSIQVGNLSNMNLIQDYDSKQHAFFSVRRTETRHFIKHRTLKRLWCALEFCSRCHAVRKWATHTTHCCRGKILTHLLVQRPFAALEFVSQQHITNNNSRTNGDELSYHNDTTIPSVWCRRVTLLLLALDYYYFCTVHTHNNKWYLPGTNYLDIYQSIINNLSIIPVSGTRYILIMHCIVACVTPDSIP